MAKKAVRVSEIVIEVQGKKLSLSPDAARDLRDALDEVLGKETVREIVKEVRERQWWYPYYTTWTVTNGTSKQFDGQVYITSNIGTNKATLTA